MQIRRALGLTALSAMVAAGSLVGNAIAAPSAQAVPSVDIVAREYAYDAPDTLPAGPVELKMRNVGHEPHHAQIFRLNNGVTYDQVAAGLRANDNSFFALITTWRQRHD